MDWCELFLLWQQELSVLFHFFFWVLKMNITGIEESLQLCPCKHIKGTLNKLIVCHAALKLNSYSPSLTSCPLSSSLEICWRRQHSKKINDASVNMIHRAMLTQVVLFLPWPHLQFAVLLLVASLFKVFPSVLSYTTFKMFRLEHWKKKKPDLCEGKSFLLQAYENIESIWFAQPSYFRATHSRLLHKIVF